MPLEGSVAKIEDLNDLWPLGSDQKLAGDDHLRNVKSAILSLLDGTNGVRQLGLDTVEYTLTANDTIDAYAGLVQRGGRVAVIIKQDGTGGWTVTWDSSWKLMGNDVSLGANTYSVFEFVVDSNDNMILVAPPVYGAS